jgi:inosose dehydratase
MRLGYHSQTWGGVIGAAQGVTSVKDLYYRSNGPLEPALRAIGAAGYTGVEVFEGNLADYEHREAEFKELLEATGLTLTSVYSGGNFIYSEILPDELAKVRHAARLAQQFGAPSLVVGGGARRASGTREDDYAKLGDALDKVVDIAQEHGLNACFHPHLSTIVESPEEVDKAMSHTRIGFCPDTAHLAAGGGDPAEQIRKYADRLVHVHLKDLDKATTTFLPLGRGDLDFPGIVAAVKETGYDDWLLVELDYYDGDPAEAARSSFDYLTELLG